MRKEFQKFRIREETILSPVINSPARTFVFMLHVNTKIVIPKMSTVYYNTGTFKYLIEFNFQDQLFH